MPRELNPSQREELAREATRELLGVHTPLAKDNIEQPHVHLMFSERAVDASTRGLAEDRFFKRNGAKKDSAWNDRNKPDEVREKWVEMMNGAMQKAGIELRVDARSWAEQGREDLAALVEQKTLRGDGPEAQERLEKIAEQRQMRAELPAPHLDPESTIEEIEQRPDEQISIPDKLIEKARELAVEVKERTVAFATLSPTVLSRSSGQGSRRICLSPHLSNNRNRLDLRRRRPRSSWRRVWPVWIRKSPCGSRSMHSLPVSTDAWRPRPGRFRRRSSNGARRSRLRVLRRRLRSSRKSMAVGSGIRGRERRQDGGR